MAAPSSYTETTLADYMQDVLQDVATAMGWTTTPDDYQNAIDEALLLYDVDDIAEVSGRANIKKLRTFARLTVWSQVAAATAGDFNFSADGGRYNREDVHKHALAMLAEARTDAMAYGLDGYEIVVDKVQHIHDPYEYVEDDDRIIP